MTQLIKHYWINRDTGKWATDTSFGLMMPNLKNLEVKHSLFTENNIPYFLSNIPEYFEYEITVSLEQLTEYQNNSNLVVVSSTERQVEVPVIDQETRIPTEETKTETVYDVIYREPYVIEESDGIKIFTQDEWNQEIEIFDNRQKEKRYNILREIRDKILELTDWMITREWEQGKEISQDFKTWRQALRDLPNLNTFPLEFPILPTSLENHTEIQSLYARFNEVRFIPMIYDPLSKS